MYLQKIGVNYYKARVYHPELGRFIQTDPIGYEDGMNWYAYVGNDPVNMVDPTGENAIALGRASFRTGQSIGNGINYVTKLTTGRTLSTILADAVWDIMHNESSKNESGEQGEKKGESKKERRKRIKKERKERKENEPASEDKVKWKAKEVEKKDGKDKRREAHDKKQKGEPDRSNKQIDRDYGDN